MLAFFDDDDFEDNYYQLEQLYEEDCSNTNEP